MGRSSTSLRVLWDSLVKMHFESDFTNITLKISSRNLKLAGLVLEPPGPYSYSNLEKRARVRVFRVRV